MAAPERKNALAGAISPACVHFHTLILPFCCLGTSCLWVYGLTGRRQIKFIVLPFFGPTEQFITAFGLGLRRWF